MNGWKYIFKALEVRLQAHLGYIPELSIECVGPGFIVKLPEELEDCCTGILTDISRLSIETCKNCGKKTNNDKRGNKPNRQEHCGCNVTK